MPVLCPHNKREENVAIKAGEVPGDWENKPSKHSRKDLDARWSEEDQKTVRGTVFPTSKPGASHYGTKNHINVDRKHQLIRRYHVTDAATHDSQAVDALLTRGNTGSGVWADAAWRSAGIEAVLKARKLTSHIHRKGKRGKPLTGQARQSNRTKSSLRVRVGHIFGARAVEPGGVLVRTIGLPRARARIRTPNIVYNMRRLGQPRRLDPCPA